MNKIHLIHGIHTQSDEVGTPERHVPQLLKAGYTEDQIVVHKYGFAFGITSRWENKQRAKTIALGFKEGDKILAHSNGCLIALYMLRHQHIKPSVMTFLQPALDVDTVFPDGDYRINVFYNQQDIVTLIARLALWFKHPYGAMGRYGYTGDDERIKCFNTLNKYSLGGHSDLYAQSAVLRRAVVRTLKTKA